MLALATWISATRCSAACAVAVIIANCFAIGGTVLLYAHHEFSGEAIGSLTMLSPIIRTAELRTARLGPTLSLLLLGFMAMLMHMRISRQCARARAA